MIYEMRTYTTRPGKLNGWLRVYEETRLPILKKHLGTLIAAFTPDTGNVNQLVQIWAYADHGDRARRRAALWSDPEWLDPTKNTSDVLVEQHSVLLQPTAFSPLS
jgi:hypothetical protein